MDYLLLSVLSCLGFLGADGAKCYQGSTLNGKVLECPNGRDACYKDPFYYGNRYLYRCVPKNHCYYLGVDNQCVPANTVSKGIGIGLKRWWRKNPTAQTNMRVCCCWDKDSCILPPQAQPGAGGRLRAAPWASLALIGAYLGARR